MAAHRSNSYAARQRFGPKTGHLPGADYPYAVIEIDQTPLDLILVDDIHRQPIGSPFLTLAIDVFSRTVAGFHLALEAPSSTSVALCLAHAILPKGMCSPGTQMAREINGTEFRSLFLVLGAGSDTVCSARLALALDALPRARSAALAPGLQVRVVRRNGSTTRAVPPLSQCGRCGFDLRDSPQRAWPTTAPAERTEILVIFDPARLRQQQ